MVTDNSPFLDCLSNFSPSISLAHSLSYLSLAPSLPPSLSFSLGVLSYSLSPSLSPAYVPPSLRNKLQPYVIGGK